MKSTSTSDDPLAIPAIQFLKLWRRIDVAEREARSDLELRRVDFLRAALAVTGPGSSRVSLSGLLHLTWDDSREVLWSLPPQALAFKVFASVLNRRASAGRRGYIFHDGTRSKPMPFPRSLWRRIAHDSGLPGLQITRFGLSTDRLGASETTAQALRDYCERVGAISFRAFRD